MTSQKFRALLKALADAWQRRDYAKAADFFAQDVKYADPLRYSFMDRASLQVFFEADEGLPQSTVWHTIVFDEQQQVGIAEYTYVGTHQYHGCAIIRVQGGKITHWREHQHIDARSWEEFIAGTAF